MNPGDRVRLVRSIGLFSPGCEGVVDSVLNWLVNVSLDKDELGNEISPPVIMPPATPDHYIVIG
jgi:hypothetical protein